jgi:hypothetical protein
MFISGVEVKPTYRGKKLCEPLITQFIKYTEKLNINYYLLNAGEIPSYKCYFNAFNKLNFNIYKIIDSNKVTKNVNISNMKQIIKEDLTDTNIYMYFSKKQIGDSSEAVKLGGNNKKMYIKLKYNN